MQEEEIVIDLQAVSAFHTCMSEMKGVKENELAVVCMHGGLYLHEGKAMGEAVV